MMQRGGGLLLQLPAQSARCRNPSVSHRLNPAAAESPLAQSPLHDEDGVLSSDREGCGGPPPRRRPEKELETMPSW
jgi:hypothetical protein